MERLACFCPAKSRHYNKGAPPQKGASETNGNKESVDRPSNPATEPPVQWQKYVSAPSARTSTQMRPTVARNSSPPQTASSFLVGWRSACIYPNNRNDSKLLAHKEAMVNGDKHKLAVEPNATKSPTLSPRLYQTTEAHEVRYHSLAAMTQPDAEIDLLWCRIQQLSLLTSASQRRIKLLSACVPSSERVPLCFSLFLCCFCFGFWVLDHGSSHEVDL